VTNRLLTVLAVCGTAASALAVDLSPITLFGQKYNVQRFDYTQSVQWPDPLFPTTNLNLIEVEGAHYLGNDRMLLSSDGLDALGSYKNWVIEVRLTRGLDGRYNGLSYVKTIVINDPITPSLGGFDLSPCGITINTGPNGLAANGDLIVGDSEVNGVTGYSISTGAQLGSWSGGPQNDSFDDLAYVPFNDRVYTINEDGYALVSYQPDGTFDASAPIPGLTALNPIATPGSPKGMVYLPDLPTVPASIRRPGGSLLITLDDNNPGLQVFSLSGAVLATEPLTDEPVFSGTSFLEQEPLCASPLQLESAAFDPATGTIFLINESSFTSCDGFYVLTPAICPGDLNADGFVDDADFVIFAGAYNILDCADPSMPAGCPADLNADSFVDDSDFVIFAAAYNELICP
jgi:hypothetical protein